MCKIVKAAPMLAMLALSTSVARGEAVCESARTLPLIEDVDVVVVGGGFSAVSAAMAAKEAGASVFVAMPRQNPGEDTTATRRLWTMSGDEGLDDPLIAAAFPKFSGALFTYTPSVRAVSPHEDDSHSVLSDGKYGNEQAESVQYGSSGSPLASVDLTVTPKAGDYHVTKLSLVYYANASQSGSYGTSAVSVWTNGTEVAGALTGETNSSCRIFHFTPFEPISVETAGSVVLRCVTDVENNCVRQLLGEIMLETDAGSIVTVTSPMSVSKALDAALLGAGIPYVTGFQVCGVLKDGDDRLAGVVVANRNGRQAIRAKAVVDATEWGVVARKVATLRQVPQDNETVFTSVITFDANETPVFPAGYTAAARDAKATYVTFTPNDLRVKDADNVVHAGYPLQTLAVSRSFPLAASDYLAVNAIAQQMRGDIWQKSVVDQSERPFFVPPEAIVGGAEQVTEWNLARDVPLTAFTPDSEPNLFVSGMLADIDRALAEKLSFPGVSVTVGRRLGSAAAARAAVRGDLSSVAVTSTSSVATPGDVRENIGRPKRAGSMSEGAVPVAAADLPVLDDVDVVVVGGGTAGGPAAIAAARTGKRVFVSEWLHIMGGVTTEMRIGRYYNGNNRGFTRVEVEAGTKGANAIGYCFHETKAEWFRSMAVNAGATVVFGAFAEGVLANGTDESGRTKIRGVVIVLPDGTRGVVKAKAIVDATGNADIAAAAGAETMFLSPTEFAMQGSAASPQTIGESYKNTDVGFLNTPDAGDISTFALRARLGAPDAAWNLAQVVTGARERRRIVGDLVVSELDELRGLTYSDTIMHGCSDYDMHGFSTSDLMMFFYHDPQNKEKFRADVPYRALLARSLEGVITTGLGISATRDAMPIIRMQPDVQNQGYAAGLAAAMACDAGSVRAIDIRSLQQQLVANGCLDARVLTDVDSGDDPSGLADAVSGLNLTFRGLPWILALPDAALPLLRTAYAASEGDSHLAQACALLLLGDRTGLDVAIAAFNDASAAEGSNFRGLGNYGRQTSAFDYLAFALMKSGDAKAAAAIARRVTELATVDGKTIRPLSHFRIVTRAAEVLASDRIAAQVAELLPRNASLSGRAKTGAVEPVSFASDNAMDNERTQAIRELAHLRTRYRFGDSAAAAGLRTYLNDYRTIYASYAELALSTPLLEPTVGTWTDVDTYEIDLGKPSAPNALAGTVRLADAKLLVNASFDASGEDLRYELMPEGDFEPSTTQLPIPNAGQGGFDRRAKTNKTYFDENFSRWIFDSSNDGSGIATDDSYFAANIYALGTGNKHAAFLFYKDSKCGRISQPFTVPKDGTKVYVKYSVESCYFDKWFLGKHYILVDDEQVDTYPEDVNGKIEGWLTREVYLGELTAGQHTLTFANNAKGDTGLVIDNVMMALVTPAAADGSFPKNQFADLHFDLADDVVFQFEAPLNVRVGSIRVNGRKVSELVDPEGGKLSTQVRGTMIFMR